MGNSHKTIRGRCIWKGGCEPSPQPLVIDLAGDQMAVRPEAERPVGGRESCFARGMGVECGDNLSFKCSKVQRKLNNLRWIGGESHRRRSCRKRLQRGLPLSNRSPKQAADFVRSSLLGQRERLCQQRTTPPTRCSAGLHRRQDRPCRPEISQQIRIPCHQSESRRPRARLACAAHRRHRRAGGCAETA